MRRFITECNPEPQRQQQRKHKYPEHDFRFSLQLEHARAQKVKVSRPPPISPLRILPRRPFFYNGRLLCDAHKLNPTRFVIPSRARDLGSRQHCSSWLYRQIPRSLAPLGMTTRKGCAATETTLSRLRFPLIQKCQQRLRSERPRVLEFAVLLADHQFAVALGYREGRNAFVQRHIELLYQIGILLFIVSQVNMHNLIARHNRCKVGPMERQVQHVAVKAPVRSKHQQHALVLGRRLLLGFFDLRVRIRIRRINILIHVRRLFQMRRIGSFGAHNAPLFALLLPPLGVGYAHHLAIRQAGLHFGFEDDALSIGVLLQADDFHFYAARFQSQPEIHIRIGSGRNAVGLYLRLRIRAVERLQSRRVPLQNRGLPLVQRRETGRVRHRSLCQRTPPAQHHSRRCQQKNYVAKISLHHRAHPFTSSHSSRKCRPVNRTNTSSKLACRVVKCCSSLPCLPTASSSAGIVRCGSFTLNATMPSSSCTDSTLGSARQASSAAPSELPAAFALTANSTTW